MPRRARSIVMALLSCLVFTLAAGAQGVSRASLSLIQTDAFPRISAYLDVRGDGGEFLSGLRTGDVTILEDGQPRPVEVLQQLQPGVQLVVALNPGRAFVIRDGLGNTRYDYLRQGLRDWVGSLIGDPGDDYSLLISGQPEVTHLPDPASWLAALESYEVRTEGLGPGLEVLSRALDVASDPTPQAGMGRGVLFITALPDASAQASLGSLADRALQSGVQVHVWLVASANLFETPEAIALQGLAAQTGGSFFAFSGTEGLPNLERELDGLRHVYLLAYDSGLVAGGSHELSVRIARDDLELTTPARTFELEILPPNPIFVSPPTEISRSLPAAGDESGAPAPVLDQELELLVEFPDGHPRPLERTVLYVDGAVVGENIAPPFDRFTWDLNELPGGGRYVLQVEAVDSLGLRGISIETPIQVNFQTPRQDALSVLSRNGPAIAAVAIVMAGAVLFFVLIVAGRLRPRTRLAQLRRRPASHDRPTRPISSRIPTRPVRGRQPGRWPGETGEAGKDAPGAPKPWAYLVKLNGSENGEAGSRRIPLTGVEITLGSDARRVTVPLDDPSVEGAHTRIRYQPQGGACHLKDMGTVAGTWVNYAPLSGEWTGLEDGDLIHVGRVGFRFRLAGPAANRRPRVTYRGPAK